MERLLGKVPATFCMTPALLVIVGVAPVGIARLFMKLYLDPGSNSTNNGHIAMCF